jgi:RES domain-containing protein
VTTSWRIVAAHRIASAFSGEGSRLSGGRWNNIGTLLVYTSGTISLAAMEIMVNLPAAALLNRYVTIGVQFDESLVEELPKLPGDWDSRPASPSTKAIGDKWVAERRSAVLKVPSVIVPFEHNYLLNPNHPDWPEIQVQNPEKYFFDPRLIK